MTTILLIIIWSLVIIYFSFIVIWPFILSLAATFKIRNQNRNVENSSINSILVLIPAYKEDAVIVNTATRALLQNYQKDSFTVCILADSLKASTLTELKKIGVEILEVNLAQRTKAKALNLAISYYDSFNYDIVAVLDADNIMCKGFLNEINLLHNRGFQAIQGQRMGKNSNTSFAVLDGLSEAINNHIYCKGQYIIGGSSRLAGSGMAFSFECFKRTMACIDVINGFDKEMELVLAKKGVRIAYTHKAVVLDEKVSRSEVFRLQRTRWLAAQYSCLQQHFKYAFSELLVNNNWNYFQKVVLLAQPPKLLLPIVLSIGLFASTLSNCYASLKFILLALLIINLLTFVIAAPRKYFEFKLIRHFIHIPYSIIQTIIALFRITDARKKFIHTPHGRDIKT
jgi:cellulose synthase/poly-beta-1,6-N-acetylglucosamine synthase-like glycosyltransferase